MPSSVATEIEYDVAGSVLYAEETDGGTLLHLIDPTTGNSLSSLDHGFGALNGLEFVGTTLYGTFIGGAQTPSDLVTVNTSTGAVTTIGPTGFGPISGLAYGGGVMYGVIAGGAAATLVSINLSTGAATAIGPTGFDRIGGIAFGPDGVLYGGTTANATVPNSLLSISTSTGTATLIGSTGFSITGLTDCPSVLGPPPMPEPIPFLSGWGIVLLMLVLGAVAVWGLRFRAI